MIYNLIREIEWGDDPLEEDKDKISKDIRPLTLKKTKFSRSIKNVLEALRMDLVKGKFIKRNKNVLGAPAL